MSASKLFVAGLTGDVDLTGWSSITFTNPDACNSDNALLVTETCAVIGAGLGIRVIPFPDRNAANSPLPLQGEGRHEGDCGRRGEILASHAKEL